LRVRRHMALLSMWTVKSGVNRQTAPAVCIAQGTPASLVFLGKPARWCGTLGKPEEGTCTRLAKAAVEIAYCKNGRFGAKPW
jgi:hypothetical protein